MRILIVNDDGMEAGQLVPLIRWCRKLGEVTAFVPKAEQSGKSHGFEIRHPFEAKEVALAPDVTVWAVDSTPADCIRLAVLGFKLKFDLAISGVNRGYNLGSDTMYSGTVGAASEAVNLGMKAIALSTPPENYDHATAQLDRIFAFLQTHSFLERHDFFNINIPADPKGIRITRQGGPYYSDDFQPMENHMFRPIGKPVWEDSGDDTLDTDATLNGYISITPMTIKKTCIPAFEALSDFSE